MPNPSAYTPDEWKTVCAAPVSAGLLVSISDISGPVGMAKEAISIVKTVSEAAAQTSSEVIRSIALEMQARRGKPDMPDLPGDRAAARTALIDVCKRAADLVAQKSPGEADEYRRLLLTLARGTAEASKEGGFLGIGGTQVSEDERNAVSELERALGASA
jgi:hypothetical protein